MNAWRLAHATSSFGNANGDAEEEERATVTIELTDWPKSDLHALAADLWANGVHALALDIMEQVGLPDEWGAAS